MKKILECVNKIILKTVPHALIIFSLAYIVLFIIDCVNPYMGFIDFWFTKYMLLIHMLLSVVYALIHILSKKDVK